MSTSFERSAEGNPETWDEYAIQLPIGDMRGNSAGYFFATIGEALDELRHLRSLSRDIGDVDYPAVLVRRSTTRTYTRWEHVDDLDTSIESKSFELQAAERYVGEVHGNPGSDSSEREQAHARLTQVQRELAALMASRSGRSA